jgi:cell division transport system permease protein
MKIRTTKYLVAQGFGGIWKNRLMSLASIGTIAACLLIVGIAYSIAANVDYMMKGLEQTLGITVYVDEQMEEMEIEQLEATLNKIAHVQQVQYVSRDEALKRLKEDIGENIGILEGLENDNPLPASFEITLEDAKYQEDVIKELNKIQRIEVKYFKDEAAILVGINNMIRIVSLILISILALIGIMLMANTIKLTVYIRKQEINIMKYIGATDWFIRWPFVMEGILIGLIGAMIPLLLIWFSYNFIIQLLYEKYAIIQNLFKFLGTQEIFAVLFPVSIFIGVGIGIIGSGISIRRYLKV